MNTGWALGGIFGGVMTEKIPYKYHVSEEKSETKTISRAFPMIINGSMIEQKKTFYL